MTGPQLDAIYILIDRLIGCGVDPKEIKAVVNEAVDETVEYYRKIERA
jgi:hypothetical protein